MPPLPLSFPRGTCPACGRTALLRKDNTICAHFSSANLGHTRTICPGTGKPPRSQTHD